MQLRELQQTIARGILADPPEALAAVVREDGLDFDRRLQVYRNNTIISLTEALKATFPVVASLVGEKFFGFAAKAFISANPPRAPRLAEYGGGFAAFLAAFEPARTLPYLADVAALEWAMNEAQHAPDDAALTPQDLAAVPPEDSAALVLELRRSCRLLHSDYRVDRLWQAHQPGGSLQDLAIDGACHLLVYRPQDDVEMMTLDAAGFALLSQIGASAKLEAAYETAAAIDRAFDLSSALGFQLTRGVFGGFSLARSA
ncbi:MAG: putative DNA-binding domain-containing protein [Dongiaceae bacterium]